MKKIISLFLCLMVLCSCTASAEEITVTLFHNKVEIGAQLEAFAKAYSDMTEGVTVRIETLGGGADYAGNMKAKLQSGQMPEIFVIDGIGNYEVWKEYCSDLSGESWVDDTDVEFTVDGKVYGFPVSIEGFGLGYNAEILSRAGIDPSTLTTFDAIKAAFEKLDGMKEELGLDAVVSMGSSVAGGMTWVTGNHSFSVYLGGGLDPADTSVIDKFNAGEVDMERLADYANYVNLLFDYSIQDDLVNGNYDQQLSSFASGKTAFLHQGNWVDPNMVQLEADFKMGYVPHAFSAEENNGIFLFAPSFYCVNSQKDEATIQAAKDFLTYMATSEEGARYMVEEAGMVPAYKSVNLQPAGGFSKALVDANARGGNYAVRFGEMPDGFGMNTLGPIFELLASDAITVEDFCTLIASAIAEAN